MPSRRLPPDVCPPTFARTTFARRRLPARRLPAATLAHTTFAHRHLPTDVCPHDVCPPTLAHATFPHQPLRGIYPRYFLWAPLGATKILPRPLQIHRNLQRPPRRVGKKWETMRGKGQSIGAFPISLKNWLRWTVSLQTPVDLLGPGRRKGSIALYRYKRLYRWSGSQKRVRQKSNPI